MKTVLMLLCFVVSAMCVAQDASGIIPQNEIDRITSLIMTRSGEKEDCHSKNDSLWPINIFHVRMEDTCVLTMHNLKDGTFLEHIVPRYVHYTKKWLRKHGFGKLYNNLLYGQFMLADQDGELVLGLTQWDGLHYYEPKNGYHKDLPKVVLKYNIFSLYHFEDRDAIYYIGVTKEKEIMVLRYWKEGIKVTAAEEFMDNEFPYLFPEEREKSIRMAKGQKRVAGESTTSVQSCLHSD